IFKNHGAQAGASMPHSHFQLLALPASPPSIAQRRANEAAHFRQSGEPLLTLLAREELARGARVLEGGERGALVFCPYASPFAYQALILPGGAEGPAQASFLEAPPEALD